jgi:hypothetical protein
MQHPSLLDDVIRAYEDGRRNRQPEHPRGSEIDHQLKSRRLLDRKISRLGTSQDLVDVRGSSTVRVGIVGPVRHESAGVDELALARYGRQTSLGQRRDDLFSMRLGQGVDANDRGIGSLPGGRIERGFKVANSSDVEEVRPKSHRTRRPLRIRRIPTMAAPRGAHNDSGAQPRAAREPFCDKLQPSRRSSVCSGSLGGRRRAHRALPTRRIDEHGVRR